MTGEERDNGVHAQIDLLLAEGSTLPQVQVSLAHYRVQRELERHGGSFPTVFPGNRVQLSVCGPHIWPLQEPFSLQPLLSLSLSLKKIYFH